MTGLGGKPREVDDLRAKLEIAIKERDEAKATLADLRPLRCSFCAKAQHDVKKLIAGPTVFICDECVDLCADIVAATGGAA
ncbi:hypothetical protein A8B82_21210 [Sulfitobacter sp. EhC04]|nr:hypothetical protein A8B82_21210 [Sulfitobacter sp. EhC04]